MTLENGSKGEKRILVENTDIGEINCTYVESATGYDMHYFSTKKLGEDNFEISWYCWYLSKEFIDALDEHGLPPTHLDYGKLMETLSD